MYAVFRNFVASAVETRAPMFYAQKPSKHAAHKQSSHHVRFARQNFAAVDGNYALRHRPHFVRHFIGVAEDDIVRHNVLIFVCYHNVFLFENFAQFERRNVAHAHGFAR